MAEILRQLGTLCVVPFNGNVCRLHVEQSSNRLRALSQGSCLVPLHNSSVEAVQPKDQDSIRNDPDFLHTLASRISKISDEVAPNPDVLG